jgi:DNA-directed RNA polymerase subunit alpha
MTINKYNITKTTDEKNIFHAEVTISNLMKGFGITLGNSMRRTLLSSIPGASMFAIKTPNHTHEFTPLKGVREDLIHVILNLKSLVITISEATYPNDVLDELKIEQ